MLLASVLMLKICLGQVTFVSTNKTAQKANVFAADSQKNIALNIASTEFDEDENEENRTEDFFIELPYLSALFQLIQTNHSYIESVNNFHNTTNHISIYKANNCFRI